MLKLYYSLKDEALFAILEHEFYFVANVVSF